MIPLRIERNRVSRRNVLSAGASRLLAVGAVAAWLCGLGSCVAARAQQPTEGLAAALQAKRSELRPQLQANSFGEPLVLISRELPDRLEGRGNLPHGHRDLRVAVHAPERPFLHAVERRRR
jgi:hypothetical protein